MTVGIALVRGINVGGKNRLPMADLRVLCEGLGLRDVATYIQSGNVVFRTDAHGARTAADAIADAVERAKGFRPGVVVRTLEEWRRVVTANPFAGRKGIDASRLLVMFLASPPSPAAAKALRALKADPDELVLAGREVFLHFPKGVAEASLPMARVERAAGESGTCRNWNTVLTLLGMGEALDVATQPATPAPKRRGRAPSRD